MGESRKEACDRLRRAAWGLRRDVVEMIGIGKAGHLGGSSSLAEIVASLYFEKMHYDPKNPKDPDRDRFLLSKGHAVLIQYAALIELGIVPARGDEAPQDDRRLAPGPSRHRERRRESRR